MHRLNRGATTDLRHILYDILGNAIVFFICHIVFIVLGYHSLSVFRTGMTAVFFLTLYILASKEFKLYDTTTFFYADRVIRRVSASFILASALSAATLFFAGRAFSNRLFYSTYFLASYAAFLGINYISYKQNRSETASMRTLLIGNHKEYHLLLNHLQKTNLAINIVGYVRYGDDTEESPEDYLGIAQPDELTDIVKQYRVDQIFLLQEENAAQSLEDVVKTCTDLGVVTHVILQPMRSHCASYISSIGTYPVISYHIMSLDPLQRMVKRTMDIIGSSVGMLLSLPILLLAAIAIRLDSPGPIFFRQVRVGRNGREFNMYKLRTMYIGSEAKKRELEQLNTMKDGFMFKIPHDPRITRVGAFLRKTSIDELPQFFNVLLGNMSLVGTRPPTRDEVAKYEPHHWWRLRIKPGITGGWQTQGRNEITDFEEVVAMDIQYIQRWNLWLDIRILLKTAKVLVKRKGAF